jgi:hypothetical protein
MSVQDMRTLPVPSSPPHKIAGIVCIVLLKVMMQRVISGFERALTMAMAPAPFSAELKAIVQFAITGDDSDRKITPPYSRLS